jgi:hypothetical protein
LTDRDELEALSPQRVQRVLQLAGLDEGPEEFAILERDLPRIIAAWRVLADAAGGVSDREPPENGCESTLAPDLAEPSLDPEIWTKNLPSQDPRGPWVPPNRGRG